MSPSNSSSRDASSPPAAMCAASAALRARSGQLATGRIGDGEQRPPVVGLAVDDAVRHLRVGGRRWRSALSCAHRTALRASTSRWSARSGRNGATVSVRSLRFRSIATARSCSVSGRVPISAITVGQNVLERARLVIVANGPQHGAALAMAAVENTAQFVVVVQEGIGLIDQQRRPVAFDDSEQRRRGDVGGGQWTRQQTTKHVEQRCLAAALHWRRYAQARRDQGSNRSCRRARPTARPRRARRRT